MLTEQDIDPNSNYDEVKFEFITPSDIFKSIKKVYRNVVFSHRKMEPRIKAMTIYLIKRIENSELDYTNRYLCMALNIKYSTEISGYIKKHKKYWENEKKYRMRLAIAIEFLKTRNDMKSSFYYKPQTTELQPEHGS